MTEQTPDHTPEATTGPAQPPARQPVEERVGRGMLGALVGVVLGAVLSLVTWRAGFITAITSFVLAAAAVFLYSKLAGAAPRRGLPPLISLIVVGTVVTFFLFIASDAAQAYDDALARFGGDASGMSKSEFVRSSLFDGDVWSAYTKDALFFFGFAVLGMWSTLKRTIHGG
jgi:hypothetical protein